MNYSNSPVPKGSNVSNHNTTKRNTLRQIIILSSVLLGFLVFSLFIIMKIAAWGAAQIPFAYEQKLAEKMRITQFATAQSNVSEDKQSFDAAQAYLQEIADKISLAKALPEDMPITVHLILDDTVNAFATLGGHVFLHQGLLSKLQSENALAMLIGHEIAHIYYRDPIRAAGGVLLTGIVVEWLTGGSGFGAAIIGEQTAQLVALGFSREQEAKADAFATQALQALYGHSAGGQQLFEALLQEAESSSGLAGFWSSHPATRDRLEIMPRSIGDITALEIDFSEL